MLKFVKNSKRLEHLKINFLREKINKGGREMARKNTKVITFTTSISTDEAEEIFKEFSKIPTANALIETFKFAADSQTFREKKDFGGYEVFASVKDPNLRASMILRQVYKRVDLLFYDGAMEEISAVEYIDDFYGEFATVSAEPRKLSALGYGEGDLSTYVISLVLYDFLYLPTDFGRWFLNLMQRFALISTEFHLDVSDQPRFWDGDKEKPE